MANKHLAIRQLLAEDGGRMFLARVGNEDAGSASAHVEGNQVILDGIETDPRYARRGLGTILLGWVCRYGRGNGATELTGEFKPDPWRRDQAEAFYERNNVAIDDEGNLAKRL